MNPHVFWNDDSLGKNAGLPILDEEASVVVVRKMNME